MPDAYDHISLMCRLKAAQTRNKELESAERTPSKGMQSL